MPTESSSLANRWRVLENPEEFRRRVGRVQVGPSLDFRSRGQVLRDFVLAILLSIAFITLIAWSSWPSLRQVSGVLLLFGAYCGFAYVVRVRPNHDEVGLAGGLVDNPLRWSDGANRFLVQIAVALALGRFISVGLVDGVRLLRHGQLPHERFMQD